MKRSAIRLNMEDLERMEQAGKIRSFKVLKGLPREPEKKKSKFGNVPTDVDGIRFDSKKQAKRYKDLLLLLKAGEIAFLRREVKYELNPGGTFSRVYRADFTYVIVKTTQLVVEDVKGWKGKRKYMQDKKLMKKIYGIDILET